MRAPLAPLSAIRPRSLDEALRLLRDSGPLMPLAGCTDVFVLLNAGRPPAQRFLDLWPLDELRGISLAGSVLRLGALATYREIIASPLVEARVPMLVDAARQIGAVQIHNRGTIGGNVANGSPAGDALPVLAATDAVVVLISAGGERRIALTRFYTGYRQSLIRPDELILAIEIPEVQGRQWFRKVGTRAAQAISKVVMAAVRDGRPRIALGSVAPTVVRVPRTEEVLAQGGSIEEAQRQLAEEIQPIDDIRSTAEYRRRVSLNLLARFWRDTAWRAL